MDKAKMYPTLKAAALIGLVESGIIERDENGDIDTAGFERFWTYFERNLGNALHDFFKELAKNGEQVTG